MSKLLLLDLFCGAGGCAKGYQDAGFYVVGVDTAPQPHYCGDEFHQADALTVLDILLHPDNEWMGWYGYRLSHVAAIHASPPCQRYSICQNFLRQPQAYPDLLPAVRERLRASGKPWVIENVPGAPMLSGLMLCGSMFGLGVLRHRYFEASFPLFAPGPCQHRGTVKGGAYISVFGKGGRGFTKERGGQAMGITWMTIDELRQAIPPVYTEWVGRQCREVLRCA
jgi:DNA (cytosine-5)-methyltransferase 1